MTMMKKLSVALFFGLGVVVATGCAGETGEGADYGDGEAAVDGDEDGDGDEEVASTESALTFDCNTAKNSCTITCGCRGFKFSKGVRGCATQAQRNQCICSNKSGRAAKKCG